MMCFEEFDATMRSHCGHYYGAPSHRSRAGRFDLIRRHGVDIADIDCQIDRIERTRQGILRDDAEHLFLLLQRSGQTFVTHGGQETTLSAGDCILLDSTSPAELGFGGQKASFVSAHLPRALCIEGRQAVRVGEKIAGHHPLAGSFHNLLLEDQPTEYGLDFFGDLVGLAFGQQPGAQDAMQVHDRRGRFGFITSVIDRNLTNPDLTLDWLAQQVCMSRRQLQREFSDHGTRFSAYLLTQRLKLAAEHLRQAARLGRVPRMAELAFQAGFGDVSNFNRAFKQRYDLSPRDFLQATVDRLQVH